MGRDRIQKGKNGREKVGKYILGLLVFVAVTVLVAAADSAQAKAQDYGSWASKEYNESGQCRYYKSIMIEPGDTLWGIALEFKDMHYGSVQEYIDELMKINGLTSDQIHAGRFLTVSYYK